MQQDASNRAGAEPVAEGLLPEKDNAGDGEGNVAAFECAIGRLHAPLFRRLVTPRCFLLLFCVLGILQGAYRTYFIGVQSTVERRFAIPSKAMGLVLTAENVSPVLAVIAGYYSGGENYNQPLWLVFGMLTVVLSCGLCVLPHFVFGPGLPLALSRIAPGQETAAGLAPGAGVGALCGQARDDEDCLSNINLEGDVTIFIMFIANLLNGFGSATFYVIGMSFMDDNVRRKNSPMYFVDPGIMKRDPRWIGAWWLGYAFIGVLVIVFSLPMLLFPRKLWRTRMADSDHKVSLASGTAAVDAFELKEVVRRLLGSPLFICHAAALVFTVNGLMGFLLATPKYMETQYRRSAATASLFSGSASLVTMLLAVLFSGAVARRLKPGAGIVSAYILVVDVLLLACFGASLLLGCQQLNVAGTALPSGELNLVNECNSRCSCSTDVFEPVCGPDEETNYFSPCFAGCHNFNNSDTKQLLDCQCLLGPEGTSYASNATAGFCFNECTMFVPFVAVLGLTRMVFATSKAGSVLIGIRPSCLHPREEKIAIAVLLTLGSIFGFIPYPVIYGAIMDRSCLVWEVNCGARGNCWVYDAATFRYLLHGVSMGFIALGAFFSLAVYVFGRHSCRLRADLQESGDEDEDVVFMRHIGHPGITHAT
ncbi:solute carrier organic anion transporter family member 74D-like isoform X2 [Dermacentor andersoni]|uniref:solute carrier organic anion transporter family member 74D-like isoform X2 n=1 Tax=Dermacentor andersoni TaxID=34620 RepID=UPI0024178148|nr:solute carrier organic anion transporter family member 74D-like isoform X2 [Dermacentor andersoni]